ncbi:MAG TPA: HNH endonuclease signature motif containing protein [Rhizomicrobium sp.]|jgi:predicted restriction endonuclease|nr:HNH endonuclease signature motif containing protein [Rhizomicrobium sp.]
MIVAASIEDKTFSYGDAAEKLGRKRDNARMVAQVCDLLDAAAAYAGIPLLALITVTEASGKINKRAWANRTGDRTYRDEIIATSQSRKFNKDDYRAISGALKSFDGMSNREAWKYVRERIPDAEIYRRIAGISGAAKPQLLPDEVEDAINDIGTDSPEKFASVTFRYARDSKVRSAVIDRAKGRCEYCGHLGFRTGNDGYYLEAHHIIALAHDGSDRMDNVIALCPNHHREAHFGESRGSLEQEMVLIVRKLNSP